MGTTARERRRTARCGRGRHGGGDGHHRCGPGAAGRAGTGRAGTGRGPAAEDDEQHQGRTRHGHGAPGDFQCHQSAAAHTEQQRRGGPPVASHVAGVKTQATRAGVAVIVGHRARRPGARADRAARTAEAAVRIDGPHDRSPRTRTQAGYCSARSSRPWARQAHRWPHGQRAPDAPATTRPARHRVGQTRLRCSRRLVPAASERLKPDPAADASRKRATPLGPGPDGQPRLMLLRSAARPGRWCAAGSPGPGGAGDGESGAGTGPFLPWSSASAVPGWHAQCSTRERSPDGPGVACAREGLSPLAHQSPERSRPR